MQLKDNIMKQATDIYTEDILTNETDRAVHPELLDWMLLANNLPTESKEYAVSTFDDTVFLATYDKSTDQFDASPFFPVLHWAEIR